jgi:tripartite-type tricarboxylate transporter receptor subunit TctC
MLVLRIIFYMSLPALMVIAPGTVFGQSYPNRPIRVVTSEPGGNGDFNARLIAQGLTGALGQPAVVDNRGGAAISGETVARANPDGYTLLAYGSSLWIGALLQDMPYDPIKDFAPITLTTSSPSVLVVHPSVQARSVKELIALAKAKPGALNYAANQAGSATQLAGDLFNTLAGVNIVAIPYKAAGPALNDLIGGQVQLMFGSAASVAPHIKSGKLIALAVTSAQPSALFPGLPTVASAGLNGYEFGSTQGLFAPAKTPTAIIKQLNEEVGRILNRSDVKERLLSIGLEAIPSTPEQFANTLKSDMVKFGKLIKDANIHAE